MEGVSDEGFVGSNVRTIRGRVIVIELMQFGGPRQPKTDCEVRSARRTRVWMRWSAYMNRRMGDYVCCMLVDWVDAVICRQCWTGVSGRLETRKRERKVESDGIGGTVRERRRCDSPTIDLTRGLTAGML